MLYTNKLLAGYSGNVESTTRPEEVRNKTENKKARSSGGENVHGGGWDPQRSL